MSKKPFEHIEDKIKEAAENYQSPYQENAWDKMNALLDKETDNKRPVPFWLIGVLIALLAGGGYWYFNSNAANNKNIAVVKDIKEEKKNNNNKDAVAVTEDGPQTKETTLQAAEKSIATKPAVVSTVEKKKTSDQRSTVTGLQQKGDITAIVPEPKEPIKKVNSTVNKFSRKGKVKVQSTGAVISSSGEDADQQKNVTADNTTTGKEETIAIAPDKKDKINDQQAANTVPAAIEPTVKNATESLQKKPEEKTVIATESKPGKLKETKKAVSKFYLLAAVGAEAASVKFLSFNNSKLAPTYGLGIGYQFSKKLGIQTGFYAGSKKYIAGHKEYHPKTGSYWTDPYVTLKKVNANCMVYEIPLAIRYTFLTKHSSAYFVTAGISSYIMKKEDYYYNYSHYNRDTVARRIYTGNKNLFSVFTFSAGIDKQLSKNIAWFAGPSFSIPVAGVGEGSVKLFSAGIQAGIRFQPSLKK